MVVCTFAGHREVFGLGQSQVVEILERLLEVEQEMTCYVGGNRNMFCYIAPKCKTCPRTFTIKIPLLLLFKTVTEVPRVIPRASRRFSIPVGSPMSLTIYWVSFLPSERYILIPPLLLYSVGSGHLPKF